MTQSSPSQSESALGSTEAPSTPDHAEAPGSPDAALPKVAEAPGSPAAALPKAAEAPKTASTKTLGSPPKTTSSPAKSASSSAPSSTGSRLSVAQMLSVMRVEFHRARAQRYPLCCLMVAVDGLEELRKAHGFKMKEAAMRAAYDQLKELAREKTFIGMALMSGDRIMAVFPNLPPSKLAEFGSVLCARARALPFGVDGTPVRLALSLGASHNLLAETNSSFEGLVEKAGRALYLASDAKGHRYVMWRESEAEIDLLREELAQHVQSFRKEAALLEEEAAEVGGLQQAALVDRIQAIFATAPRTPDTERLEKEIIALAVEELYEGRRKAVEAQMAEHARQVDQLERRIAKLTSILGVTEEELQRVMAMKHIDEGVASIYRSVQGLSMDAAAAEAKRAMMSEIFRQNLAFQKREGDGAHEATGKSGG